MTDCRANHIANLAEPKRQWRSLRKTKRITYRNKKDGVRQTHPVLFIAGKLPPRAAAVRAIGLSRRHGLAAVAAVSRQALAAMRAKSKAGVGRLTAVRARDIAR
jgi:hypothetical protein